MRIIDWSSDVCSSDLAGREHAEPVERAGERPERQVERRFHAQDLAAAGVGRGADAARGQPVPGDARLLRGCQRAEQRREVVGVAVVGIDEVGDRKSVVEGKSVYVSVDRGGRRIIKKKKKINNN